MKILKLTPPTKDYIWGGTRLSKEFGILSFEDRQAEAWMLSCHEAGHCVIENGDFKERTLADVLANEGKDYLGTNCKRFRDFPILIKLIDALDNLSVQVHPDDAYALEHEGEFGKTEAWYIVDCDGDAEIIYGFKEDIDKETFRKSIEENTLLDYVNRVKVKKVTSSLLRQALFTLSVRAFFLQRFSRIPTPPTEFMTTADFRTESPVSFTLKRLLT